MGPLADPRRSPAASQARTRTHFRSAGGADEEGGGGEAPPERQRPVGDTDRHEPRQVDAIIDAELQRALEDSDPLRGIAQLAVRLAAAFVLDPAAVTRTKALGPSAQIGWRASCATRCPGPITPFARQCGSSCVRCSRPRWHR